MDLSKLSIVSQAITAKSRKLNSGNNKNYRLIGLGDDVIIKRDGTFTIELQSDLQAAHGLDIESEMMKALSLEIQNELDREILSKMVDTPKNFTGVEINDENGKYKLNNGLYIPYVW